jgi:hypothetical protein
VRSFSPIFVLLYLPLGLTGQETPPQPPSINSDRPGYSDGTGILQTGEIQFESGSTIGGAQRWVDVNPDARRRYLTGGSPTIRVGISRRIEFRAGGDGMLYQRDELGASRSLEAGYSDFSAGVKVGLWQQRQWVPAVTLIPLLSLPSGTGGFTSSALDPTFKVAWSKDVPFETTVSGNWNMSWLSTGERGRCLYRAVSLQASRPLWKQLSGFGEVYRILPPGHETEPRTWTFDAGVAYPVAANLQIDISAGQQIVPWSRTWFLSVGMVLKTMPFGHHRH